MLNILVAFLFIVDTAELIRVINNHFALSTELSEISVSSKYGPVASITRQTAGSEIAFTFMNSIKFIRLKPLLNHAHLHTKDC